ncbi:MAG: DoxX family protein [Phycisphaeraceae bacterium]|nr:DoxX family protein [Phycisphaeraceae bacterium]MBX3407204.1 DoxX family protein [Phycisphaeraceae bacterium]
MHANPKGLTVVGLVLTALVALLLTFSAVMKFLRPPEMIEQFEGVLGYPARLAVPIGMVELLCVVLFIIPRTAALGAVLLTGYLGGAIATHVRIGDQFIAPVIVGVVVWLALFMRDPRVRSLLPLRRTTR